MQNERSGQNNSHLGETLTSYCFGGLPEADRDQVERHLMECETCWEEFQRLDAAVRTLRFDVFLRPALPVKDVVSLMGLSSRLDRPFAGHAAFALSIAALYGLEWTIGLWSELGYAYDRFGMLAWRLSGPVAVCVTASVLVALWVDVRAVRAARTNGLIRSVAVAVGCLGLLVLMLMFVLPDEPTILASFQTRTAAVGYFKDAVVIFLPLLLFVVPTFHTIIVLQRELRAGRAGMVVALLISRVEGLVPRGVWYLTPSFFAGFLLATFALKVAGTNHMLDALTPGPYASLFSIAAYVSTFLWLAIGLTGVVWYSTTLNELKREAMALVALTERAPNRREH